MVIASDRHRLCILCVFCTICSISNNLVSLIYIFLIHLAGDAAVKTEGENAPENAQQEVTASA